MYFESLNFDEGKCVIRLLGIDKKIEVIKFDFIKSFSFFKESDLYDRISLYEKVRLFRPDGIESSVYKIEKNSIFGFIHKDDIDINELMYFLVWTPDECFEISCFDAPNIV